MTPGTGPENPIRRQADRPFFLLPTGPMHFPLVPKIDLHYLHRRIAMS